jgi:hypothetical protein
MEAPVPGLDPRVVTEGLSVLDGLVGRVEELDLACPQRASELPKLVRVAGGEQQPQRSILTLWL